MDNKKNAEKTQENAEPKAQSKEVEYLEQLQRLQAEFENYKKRQQTEQEQLRLHLKSQLLLKFLDIKDNFERTLKTNANKEELTAGIEMISKQVSKLLEEEQVKPIEAKGQKLDPYKHEVLAQTIGEEDDVIAEELQKGYTIKGKVLRTAKLMISKKEEQK